MVIGRIGHNGPKPRKDPVGIRNKLPEIWVARQKRPKYKNEKRKAVRRSALHRGISSIFVSGSGSLSKVFRFIFLAPARLIIIPATGRGFIGRRLAGWHQVVSCAPSPADSLMLVVSSVAISEVLEDACTNCLFRFMLRDSVDFSATFRTSKRSICFIKRCSNF